MAAQAFHWFDPIPTQKEFRRILKREGVVAIIFNDRKTTGSRFAEQYEELLNTFGSDYKDVKHRNITEKRHREFLGDYRDFHFPNYQKFDFEGLLGRVKSSSYMPNEKSPHFPDVFERVKEIFEKNQKQGHVVMEYVTQVFCSRLNQQKIY